MPVKSLAEWIDGLQAHGRYTFLRAQAIAETGLSAEAVKKALQRLALRRRVAKVKNYFYVIVPLEYREAGGPPPVWFIDDLMAAMKLPYYVGLLSAAALHGASHQQPQEFQVITDRSVRPLRVGRARIRFFVNKNLASTPLARFKTPTGAVNVSSPEATAVDLLRFARGHGNLDHVATVVSELAPQMNSRKLLERVRGLDDLPTTQRLGYLLDFAGAKELSLPLHRWIRHQEPHMVALRPGGAIPQSVPGDRRWHVLVDEPLEVEA